MSPIATHASLDGAEGAPAWFLHAQQAQQRRERRYEMVMHLMFRLQDQWQTARFANMHVERENLIAPLHRLPPVPGDGVDADGLVVPELLAPPAMFPATIGDLRALTGPQLTEMLAAYGLPTNGDRPAKLARFVSHLGLRPLR